MKKKIINTNIKLISVILEQIKNIENMVADTDPWLSLIYTPVFDKFKIILTMNRFDYDEFEELRDILHICNSSIANMSRHGCMTENLIQDEKLFSYLYSVYDFLLEEESLFKPLSDIEISGD